jgi:polygalacturonase
MIHHYDGTPGSKAHARNNTAILNAALLSLQSGDTLLIPNNNTYWLTGGVFASNLVNVTISLDATLKFLPGRAGWPTQPCPHDSHQKCVQKAILFTNVDHLTLTSSNVIQGGIVDGGGAPWWGYANYLLHGEDRPKLFTISNGTNLIVERWHLRQSPYHTFHFDDVRSVIVRYCSVDNRVNRDDSHTIANLAALNTDGFDVSGKDIHIHDCSVWNQDDCFTIVPTSSDGINANCTENILVENVNASGLGLTVGSIEPTASHACIKNITFRNAYMHHTYKGIYVKSANRAVPPPVSYTAEITNILYVNITMEEPEQVPIWLGPAQELDSSNACSLLWPLDPFAKCPSPLGNVQWRNITLKNIQILNPKESPGVIFGNSSVPMQGVVFDNVVVTPLDEGKKPWGDQFYYCKGVKRGVATGGTKPVPPCFDEE